MQVLPSVDHVALKAAELTALVLNNAICTKGRAVWVLAGGTSPQLAYNALARAHRTSVDWQKVTVLMGDERCVPLDHPESNWGQVEEPLERLGVTQRLVPPVDLPADAAAEVYEASIAPLDNFDLVWLGIGEDGHTLSLFPGRTYAEDRLVRAIQDSPKPPAERITLTLKALEGTQNCLVFATGAPKAKVVQRARRGDISLPVVQAANTVQRHGGRVVWLLDTAVVGD